MTAKSKTYADRINDVRVMANALRTNFETLKKRGMTQEFIDLLEDSLGNIIAQNSEQERLKAELRAATAAVRTLMAQLHEQMKEAVNSVQPE